MVVPFAPARLLRCRPASCFFSSPSGLLSLRLDEVAAAQAPLLCGRALWHLPHLPPFDPLIDWLQERRINRAQKSRFRSPLWSGLDKVQGTRAAALLLSIHRLRGRPGRRKVARRHGSLAAGCVLRAQGLRAAPVHNWLPVMGLFRSQGWKWNSWAPAVETRRPYRWWRRR